MSPLFPKKFCHSSATKMRDGATDITTPTWHTAHKIKNRVQHRIYKIEKE
jgi:hypothetical protein